MIKEDNVNEITMNLSIMIKTLLRNAWIILIAVIICGAGMAVYSSVPTPQYKATALVYISVDESDTEENVEHSDEFITFIGSRMVVQNAIDYTNLNYSSKEIQAMLNVSVVENTEMFNIEVTNESPKEAVNIANAISQSLVKQVPDFIDNSFVKIIDEAVESEIVLVERNMKKDVLLGIIGGFVLSCGMLILLEIASGKVNNKNLLLEAFNIPILSSVSLSKRKSVINESNEEEYKILRTNIIHRISLEESKIIGITSTGIGEGKHEVSNNLAYEMAKLNKKTLIIDANMRDNNNNCLIDSNISKGLSDILSGNCSINEVIQNIEINENLFIIASGRMPLNPAELLASDKMGELIRDIKKSFDVVIITLPAINHVADTSIVARYIDGMAFVVKMNCCKIKELISAIHQLEFVDVDLMGFVVTERKLR